jgi:hypothetical protein
MPPRLNSRYEGSLGRYDEDDNLYLTQPEPFRYDPDLEGTRQHQIGTGDSWQSIAFQYFKNLIRPPEDIHDGWGPEHLWWLVCWFQPMPILDPTLPLEVGRVLEIPADEVVRDRVFGA